METKKMAEAKQINPNNFEAEIYVQLKIACAQVSCGQSSVERGILTQVVRRISPIAISCCAGWNPWPEES